MEQLIGIAHSHLDHAMEYVAFIPSSEVGIRRFCLWAIGMAILTLRKINRNRGFRSGSEVKISRSCVKAIIAITHITGGNGFLLRTLFRLAGLGLPKIPVR